MSNGWKQGKTLSNGWILHTNWRYGSKEYRSPCGNFKVEQLRDKTWRLMQKSTYPDASPLWEKVPLSHMSRASSCFRIAEEIKEASK